MGYEIEAVPVRPMPASSSAEQLAGSQEAATSSSSLFDLVVRNFWMIAGVSLLFLLGGIAYVLIAEPVYRATMLVQVNDVASLPGITPTTDRVRTFDVEAATATETEVLRSRSVVAPAMENARLHISVEPMYFPVLGAWAARFTDAISTPGTGFLAGYVWGAERATIARFDVPAELENTEFILTAGPRRTWRLEHAEKGIALAGRTGMAETFVTEYGEIHIQVDELRGNEGAAFRLTRSPKLSAVEKLQKDLSIAEKGKQSGIIAVSLEHRDPRTAFAVLQEIADQYLQQNEARTSAGAVKLLAFLDRQLPELQEALRSAEERYNEARQRHGSINLGEESRGLLQLSVLAQTKLMDLNQRKAELDTRYGNAHPAIQGLEEQLKRLERESARINARIRKLPALEQEMLQLQRDVNVNTEVYTSVVSSAQQLKLESASKVGNVRLLDWPEVPVQPVKPKKPIIVVTAGVIGALAGIGFALMRNRIVRRVNKPDEIEQELGVPVIAAVPPSDRKRKRIGFRAPGQQGPQAMLPVLAEDGVADSLRRFLTALPLALGHASNNVILITGPTPGVGKSFIASNFAAVLASSGSRVLLVDCDLRTGHMHRTFGQLRAPGLWELTRGDCSEEEAVRRVSDSLYFISTGEVSGPPAETLVSPRFENALHKLAVKYDYVVVDSAPVLAVADTLMIARHAGSIFNVVRAGASTIEEVDETNTQLRKAGAPVAGIILNHHAPHGHRYSAYATERATA